MVVVVVMVFWGHSSIPASNAGEMEQKR